MKNDARPLSAFAALADPTRRRILKLLRAGSQSAGQIADAFQLTKPTLSHHFKVLREAGLVRAERRGTSIVYTLQSNVLEDLAAEIIELADGLAGSPGSRGSRAKRLRSSED